MFQALRFLVVSCFPVSLCLRCCRIDRPELMPPGPYHPRALHEVKGYHVHPWVRVDPEKQYTLKIWSTRWPMFRDGYGYDDLVEEVISEFQAEYGNVDVEYVLLPLDEVGKAISEAVENRTPPDICIGPFDPSLVGIYCCLSTHFI